MEEFQTTKGFRQRCCLFPTLFKIYFERTLKAYQRKCRNMLLQVEDDILSTLYFAENQVVIAEDKDFFTWLGNCKKHMGKKV